jgi:hypothetical protein
LNLFSHIEPSFLRYELTNRGAHGAEREITSYRFPKVSNNLVENNIAIDHNSPSLFRSNQNSPQPSGFSGSILPWIIRRCFSAVMPLPWRVFPVFSSRPPPFHDFCNIRGHISYSFPKLDICQVKLMSPNDKICGSNLWLLEPILL